MEWEPNHILVFWFGALISETHDPQLLILTPLYFFFKDDDDGGSGDDDDGIALFGSDWMILGSLFTIVGALASFNVKQMWSWRINA